MFDFAGFYFFISVAAFMLSMLPVILTFPIERSVFLKEENSKLYTVKAYFIGRSLFELPFLIIFPLMLTLIVYWLVGLRNETDTFFIFLLITIC